MANSTLFKRLPDLTNGEIKQILKDVFGYLDIKDITRLQGVKEIAANMLLEVETPNGKIEKRWITVYFNDKEFHTYQLDIRWEDNHRLQQFLLVKGCNELWKENPYVHVA